MTNIIFFYIILNWCIECYSEFTALQIPIQILISFKFNRTSDTNEVYLLLVYIVYNVYLYGKYIKRNFCLVLRTVKNY